MTLTSDYVGDNMPVNRIHTSAFVLLLLTSTAASFVAAPASAKSSCSADLRRTQIAVDRALEQHAGASPSAPESRSAKLSHQPTPSTIARAENRFDHWPNGDVAVAALKRARQANKRGDLQGCREALGEAHTAIGANR
jgi:hypothetical protein